MKTEKEKMLSGTPYISSDRQLVEERQKCRKILNEFNQCNSEEKRKKFLFNLFGKIGKNFYSIEPSFKCDYGYNIEIGDNFFANFNCVFLDCNKILIGNDVMIGPGVHIYTASHPLDPVKRAVEYVEMAYPVNIGNKVWIGGGVIINPGISIGENSVIGSGSVVTKNIPPNVVAVGNPCKIIKNIGD